jgi:chlorite dismutase
MDFDLDEIIDIREKGAVKDGERLTYDKRLFMQLLAFGRCKKSEDLVNVLKKSGMEAVLYEDINDPQGVALLTMSEDPDFFITKLRPVLNKKEFTSLEFKPEYTMFGRTYSIGHEANLEDWLLYRSRRTVMNPDWPWVVWYPLKRLGNFSILPREEQGGILMEHGLIGRAFGKADLGHDIRLACYGLDKNDNDIVIGLIGKELHPLSALVQTMRKTKQTSTYMREMGPFWIGKVVWQSHPTK